MSFNMKTEPIVELSSDEDDSTQNGISNEIKRPDRPGTPETHCSICLEELTNKCYSDSCWHMFCFECLKQWSTIQSSCPLCKKSFKVIHHTFNDQGLHESYQVPLQERELPSRITFHPVGRLSEVNRIFRMNLFLDIVRRSERMHILPVEDHNHNVDLHTSQFMRMNPLTRYEILSPRNRQNGQIIRARVYSENVWAEPLPDLSGRFRECSSVFYRENPAQTHRLHGFILRDVIAIRSLERSDMVHSITTDDVVTSMIMQSVINFDIREPYMIGLLRPYLGDYAAHFCHELYNYAHSPYDMIGYDRNVRYSTRQSHSSSLLQMSPSIFQVPIELPELVPIINIAEQHSQSETIVLDSDDDDIGANTRQFGPEVIVLTSSSEESDVEIIRHSYNPPIDSSSRDQPSTSTGIRDSLDRPNNRYNFRRRRFFSSPSNDSPRYPVHMSRMAFPPEFRRGITLDSSSDDEESSTSSHPPPLLKLSELVCSRRKRQIKKNKQKKRKKTDNESRPDGIGSRSRSYSGSSSSSGDTDTRSNPTRMSLRNIVL